MRHDSFTSESEEPKFGSITFSGKDIAASAKFERLAVGTRRQLYMVSIVAETNFVKAIRAILGGGARAEIVARGARVNLPGAHPGDVGYIPDSLNKVDELYDCHIQRLDHGLTHALFIARTEGFMVTTSDEALWKELMDVRYTTPLLRVWLPYIRSQLDSQSLLLAAHAFRCQCSILKATTADLDRIVSAGLRSKSIVIPQSKSRLDLAS